MRKLLIVDFSNLFYMCRPHHIDEFVMNGGYGATQLFYITISSYIKLFEPDSVIIADDSYSDWRRDIYPLYKANRKHTDLSDLEVQYERNKNEIRKSIHIFPFHYFRVKHLEADDIIHLYCKFSNPDDEKIILSTDKDLLQILKFPNVKQFHTIKKEYLQPFEYDIVRYKCLVGDSSDNIKGMPKIGEVGAKKILSSKRSFNEWYKSLDEEKTKLYQDIKKIIDMDKIPEEYVEDYKRIVENHRFKKYNEEKIDEYCEEKRFKKFNIQTYRKLYQNLT